MSPCFSIVPLKGLYQHLYQRCFPVLVFVLQILCWLCIHSDDILSSIYSRSLSFILRHKSILPLKVKHLGNVNPRHSLSLFSFTLPLHHAFRKGKTWMCVVCMYMGFPGVSVKNLPAMQETRVQGSRRSPGERNGYPLQYSCLENSMNRGPWWAAVHEVGRVRHDWVTNS